MNNTPINTPENLLPFSIIVSAANGNSCAIDKVLKHYNGYIAVLSMRTLYDEQGIPHLCIDEELRHRLESKLIMNITKFNLA